MKNYYIIEITNTPHIQQINTIDLPLILKK